MAGKNQNHDLNDCKECRNYGSCMDIFRKMDKGSFFKCPVGAKR